MTARVPGAASAALTPPLTSDGILAWTFTTAGPYPANGGGTLAVSADCKTDFTGTVTGPSTTTVPGQTEPSSTPANTVTTALTCKCDKLAVSIKTSDLYAAAAQLVPERDALARIGALVSWTLTCSAGGGNCTGRIAALPPPKSDAKVKVFTPSTIVPKTGPYKGKTLFRKGRETPPTIECNGPCNASRTGKFFLQVDSANDLLPATRARETIVLRFEIKCMTTSTQKIKLVFKANGDLDRPKSTLTK